MYNAFANKIESYGRYDCILYTGESFYNTYFDKTIVKDDLWIAKYSTKEPQVGRKIAIGNLQVMKSMLRSIKAN